MELDFVALGLQDSPGDFVIEIASVWSVMLFPLLVSSGGIVGSILTMIIVDSIYQVKVIEDVEHIFSISKIIQD